jgi:hypothetical protein
VTNDYTNPDDHTDPDDLNAELAGARDELLIQVLAFGYTQTRADIPARQREPCTHMVTTFVAIAPVL